MGSGRGNQINDLDLDNWKDLTDIWTDSLWIVPSRDNSGAHNGNYHGNFIPQIPHQLLLRYTKAGDFVLDPFSGSGTTIIEAQRLGRNSIGIDLLEDVANESKERIKSEGKEGIVSDVYVGDSRTYDIKSLLKQYDRENVQFILYHPPYWDIIKFSDNPNDLSNSKTLEEFLNSFKDVVVNTSSVLENGRCCAVVIGDKYSNGEIVPLSMYCVQMMMNLGFKLKATIVKNITETKGKGVNGSIWRYRSLRDGYFVFKHEYIYLFTKLQQKTN